MHDIESAAKEVGGLRLPSNLEPLSVVGSGSCSIVFKASFRSETVAMKAYRTEAIDHYRRKYDVNIGVYEMSRNRAFRKVPELLPYTAKPLSVMGHDGKHSLIFLQEFIRGTPLLEVASQNQGIPESALEAVETIVRMAEINDLHDLGLAPEDTMLRQVKGVWQPVLHDFNGMPEYLYPPNPLIKMAFRTGARKKSHRDYKALEAWRKL